MGETTFNNKDGEVVLGSKKDRGDDFEFVIGVPGKKGKKGKKNAGGAGEDSKKKLVLNMENFGDWSFLGLDPPTYTSDLPGLLTKLEEKKVQFEQKVKDWEQNKEEMKKKILDGTLTLSEAKGDAPKEAEKEEE